MDSASVAGAIANLGYPQFRHLSGGVKEDPAAVLLAALASEDLEVRAIEALPWLVASYPDLDWNWLVAHVVERGLQNRLGFIVTLARRVAEKDGKQGTSERLRPIEEALSRARIVREDTLCQASLSDAERQWLRGARSEDAQHWNLLTDIGIEHLFYGA